MRRKVIKFFLLFFILTLFVEVFLLSIEKFFNNSDKFFPESVEASLYDSVQQGIINQPEIKPVIRQTVDSDIDAESYISVKVQSNQQKILLSRDEKKKLPIASLVKLMSALVVLENYNLSQKVTISDLAISQEGEQGNLRAGEILSVKNLFYMMLVESSNRAAFALSEVIGKEKFINLMNYNAQKLGLINTYFEDSTGLDPESYSTAEDIAKLSGYLFENYPLFREIINIKEFDLYLDDGAFHHKIINTNKLLGENNIVGGKTGWTDAAKGCFMVVRKNSQNDNYLIYVILGASGDRFSEMQKLINLR